MKVLYCDATLGVSGDMFLGALVDLGVPLESITAAVDAVGVSGADISAEPVTRRGIRATRVVVEVREDHHHRTLADIHRIIIDSSLDDAVKTSALAVFQRLADAEAAVHGRPVEEIRFHEVGALDAVIDVVGAATGLHELAPDLIVSSPVAVGTGFVTAQHGVLPVPAPATTELLRGAAVTGGQLQGECSTPTGVAILRHFAPRQDDLPSMTIENVGVGAGGRDPDTHPNCFRLLLGRQSSSRSDTVQLIETNVDDMSPQCVAYLFDALLQAGALDVYATAVQMKKGRPGFLLTVITAPEKRPVLEEIIFRETTTIGLRYYDSRRTTLDRSLRTVDTPFGKIDVKLSSLDGRVITVSPEYDHVARAARAHGVPFREVHHAARASALREETEPCP